MEDKLDLLLSKLNKLEETILEMKETIDAHRVEHGFAKMQDGGVNSQFDQSMGGPMGGQGLWVVKWVAVAVIRCLEWEALWGLVWQECLAQIHQDHLACKNRFLFTK